MNRITGKLIGVILGILMVRANPAMGALLGLLLGHAVDAGWLRRAPATVGKPETREWRAPDDPAYAELGVPASASDAEIEQAYRRLISQNHPDRFARDTPARQRDAHERTRRINTAYDRIRSLRRRPPPSS